MSNYIIIKAFLNNSTQTNSVNQSPAWEPMDTAAKDILRLLRIRSFMPTNPILSQINPLYTILSYLFNTNCNITSNLRLDLADYNFVRISHMKEIAGH
jgi:hypothetical protein